ncbi:glycosyltransferase [Ferruginibacter sp.]|nr:glycosyltransferase [Ferruginibacter sp.]
MNAPECNILVMGVSCFDGMASSMRVRNLIEPLVEKKLISVSNLIYQKDNKEPIGKAGTLNNINFKVIGFRLKNIFSVFGFIFGGLSFIKKSKKWGYKNILYNYNYPDIKNIWFILFAKLLGYKVIFDVIEDNSFQAHVGFINKLRIKTSVFLFNYSRHFANGMIGISEHLYKLVQKVTKNKIPAYLIPITVNLKYFKKNGIVKQKDKIQIFYGGSFGQKDGLEYLIKAFDEVSLIHSDAELIFTGMGHKLDMDRINAQIENATNKDKIIYKGFLNTNDYYTLLNECDIFCMTRVNSKFANAGFPFKLGEFLASGKAVIATNVGDVPNYLFNDINAMVVNPDSVEEIVDALLILIEHPEKRQALGKEARKTAEKFFDSDAVGMKLLSIFHQV